MSDQTIDQQLVQRVTAAAVVSILRELGHVEAAPPDIPEYLSDADIRRRFFSNCARGTYATIKLRPGFPPAVQPSGPHTTTYRRVEDVRRWLAEQAA